MKLWNQEEISVKRWVGGWGVTGMITPSPLELVPILKTYVKCAWPGPMTPPPLGMWVTSHGQCPRGVLVNVQEWGYFSIFRRADDVTRTMSKGGGGWCLWMSSPPLRKSCIRAWIGPPPKKKSFTLFRPLIVCIHVGLCNYIMYCYWQEVSAPRLNARFVS